MKKILLSLLLVTSGLAYSFEPVLGRDYSLLENTAACRSCSEPIDSIV